MLKGLQSSRCPYTLVQKTPNTGNRIRVCRYFLCSKDTSLLRLPVPKRTTNNVYTGTSTLVPKTIKYVGTHLRCSIRYGNRGTHINSFSKILWKGGTWTKEVTIRFSEVIRNALLRVNLRLCEGSTRRARDTRFVGLHVGGELSHTPATLRVFYQRLFDSNNFAGSVGLLEVCALRSAFQVIMRPSSVGGGRILRRTLSVCLSVRPVIVYIRTVLRANIQNTKTLFSLMGQRHVNTFRHAQRAAYRTAISAAQTYYYYYGHMKISQLLRVTNSSYNNLCC